MDIQYQNRLNDCSIELEKIEEWISKNPIDDNIQFLVSYSVIKASGTIEVVLKQFLFDYLAVDSRVETIKYLEKHIIEASFNPSTGAIEKMLAQFDGKVSTAFCETVKSTEEKSNLNSLVELRNCIAHGRTITSSIKNVKLYYVSGMTILNWLEALLKGKEKK